MRRSGAGDCFEVAGADRGHDVLHRAQVLPHVLLLVICHHRQEGDGYPRVHGVEHGGGGRRARGRCRRGCALTADRANDNAQDR